MRDLIYILIVQITFMLVLIITLSSYFNGREYHLNFFRKTVLGFFIGLFLSFTYIFSITNYLYLFVIVFCILALYLGYLPSICVLLVITVFKTFYYGIDIFLLLIPILIFFVVLIDRLFKNLTIKNLCVFILALFCLNLEIGINHEYFLVINLFAILTFPLFLYLVAKIYINYLNFYERKKQFYFDVVSNVRNYYCLIDNSYRILHKKNNNIAIILIHINDLRDINNLYGMYFGNKVIKLVAEIIKQKIADLGTEYRIDGDTFCVVSHEKAKIIQTICDRIKYQIDIKEVINDNNKIKVSVTIGAYCGFINSKNIDDYIELAQDALYEAKSLGGNKVIINTQV